MPGTNTLAYLALLSAMKEKSFTTLTPDFKVRKLFSTSLSQNKLECLSTPSMSLQTSLVYVSKAGVENLSGINLKGRLLVEWPVL